MPSNERKLLSRQRILESATELFCRYGFNKVSITQVMSSARMTHGAFYAHFESKEALFRETLVSLLQRGRTARLAKAPFTLEHLTQLVNNYLNLCNLRDKPGPGPEMILFNDIAAENREIRQLYEKAYLSMIHVLETRIKALARMGKVELSGNAREVARTVLATMVGAVAIAKSIEDRRERERILSAAQDQVLSLIRVEADMNLIDPALLTNS